MENPGITATLKAGTGFDSPWIVLHAADAAQLDQQLNDLFHNNLLVKVASTALQFVAANNAAPLAEQTPAPAGISPAQQYNPVAEPQQAQAPQYAPPPQQQQHAFQGGVSPQQNAGGPVCSKCGAVLERKNTQGGKAVLRCAEWRWNNGSPNGHDSEFL